MITRYCTRPFPHYRYIPGRAPHPTRDPDGHSYGEPPVALEKFTAADWPTCAPYLYGIDLFNHRYWWESHEALEQCWVAAGRSTETGLFLQGLIQIAVACLKHEQGFLDVARRMAQEGMEKFPSPPGAYLGVDSVLLRRDVLNHLNGGVAPRIRLAEVASLD